jgi:hypothetical protein
MLQRRMCIIWIMVGLSVISLIGCRPKGLSTQSEWIGWFDTTFAGLPKWNVPQSAADGTVWASAPDDIVFRLDPGYHKRNDYGCWNKLQGQPPTAILLRDLCVHRIETHLRPRFTLEPQPRDPRVFDQVLREAWQAGAVTLSGRRAIVEKASVSGGIQGSVRRWETSVLIELRKGEWVLVEGMAPDEARSEEFIQIASTIEVGRKHATTGGTRSGSLREH